MSRLRQVAIKTLDPDAPLRLEVEVVEFTWVRLVKGRTIYGWMSKHMLNQNQQREWLGFEPVHVDAVEERAKLIEQRLKKARQE